MSQPRLPATCFLLHNDFYLHCRTPFSKGDDDGPFCHACGLLFHAVIAAATLVMRAIETIVPAEHSAATMSSIGSICQAQNETQTSGAARDRRREACDG